MNVLTFKKAVNQKLLQNPSSAIMITREGNNTGFVYDGNYCEFAAMLLVAADIVKEMLKGNVTPDYRNTSPEPPKET